MLRALVDFGQFEKQGLTRAAAIQQMTRREDWYDPQILVAIHDALELPGGAEPAAQATPRAVTFANLRVGHVLVSDLLTQDGTLILSAGNRITPPLIERLRNFAALSGIKEPIHIEG
jgi:hypothetical protein